MDATWGPFPIERVRNVQLTDPEGSGHRREQSSLVGRACTARTPPPAGTGWRFGVFGGRDALEGGQVPSLPSRAPSLCPAAVSLTPSASLNGICNRQYPPPTALATSSNRLPNRFWGRPQVPPFLMHPCLGGTEAGGAGGLVWFGSGAQFRQHRGVWPVLHSGVSKGGLVPLTHAPGPPPSGHCRSPH